MPAQPEHPVEVVTFQFEVAGVVEVAHPTGLGVEHLGNDRALHVVDLVGHPASVGQEPRVDLDGAQPPELELLDHMVEHWSPHVELRDLQPVEGPEILGGVLEEGPLVALEVGAQGEGSARHRVEPECMEHLDPHVDVAVGLRPVAFRSVQRVGSESIRGQGEQGDGHATYTDWSVAPAWWTALVAPTTWAGQITATVWT